LHLTELLIHSCFHAVEVATSCLSLVPLATSSDVDVITFEGWSTLHA
jgi:hypothetical protein